MTKQQVFDLDLARMNDAIDRCGALVTLDEGVFIDPAKVPASLASAYSGLLQYGYANGLI